MDATGSTAVRFNPFPGLRPFEMRDRIVFFGREDQTAELLGRLRATRFLAVVGTSGSGKSSLVRAGLLPALHGGFMAGAGSHWKIAVMRPGGDPVGNLATALWHTRLFDVPSDPVAFVRATLARSARGLIECAQQSQLPAGHNLLIVVDQFEEVFRFRRRFRTLEEEAGGFVRLLLEAVQQQDRPIYIVLTMRSDFLGECSEFSGLAETTNDGQYLVPRMSRKQLRLAIDGPIRVAGGQISGRLVQRLLNDLGSDPDQLPILQHALMRTWDYWTREQPATEALDLPHYEAMGTVTSALSRHLDEAFAELPSEADRTLTQGLFKALTELGSDNRGVRRPSRLKELCEILATDSSQLTPVIDRFRQPGRTFLMPPMVPLAARYSEILASRDDPDGLVEKDEDDEEPEDDPLDAPQASLGPDSVIDISHESLMRVWTRLHRWVEEEAASAAIYRRLAESARLHEQGQAGLYRDPELQIALDWKRQQNPTTSWGERYAPGCQRAIDFLKESSDARQAARRAVLRHRRILVGLISIIAIVFFFLWQEALRQYRIATARWFAARANHLVGAKPRESVLLAAKAMEFDSNDPTALRALRRALFASHLRRDNWDPLPENVSQVSIGVRENRVLLARGTNVYVFSWRSPHPVQVLSGHSDLARAASFSPDGSRALTAGWDQRALLWELDTGTQRLALTGHLGPIVRAAFSLDGSNAVTASRDRTARIWRTSDGIEVARLMIDDEVWSAGFDHENQRVALGTRKGQLSIWRWRETNKLWSTTVTNGFLFDVRFAPGDSDLLSATENGNVGLWRPLSNPSSEWVLRTNLSGLSSRTYTAIFSPNGQFVAAAGEDATRGLALIWDRKSGQRLVQFPHPEPVQSLAFSADGRMLVTSCDDGQIRAWDVGIRRPLDLAAVNQVRWISQIQDEEILAAGDGSTNVWLRLIGSGPSQLTRPTGDVGIVTTAAMAPRTHLLVTAGPEGDKALHVWNSRTWQQVTNLTVTRAPISLAFSPDGHWLVVTHFASASIWNTETWRPVTDLTNHFTATIHHDAEILHAGFSYDGRRLVTSGADLRVIIWDTRTWNPESALGNFRSEIAWAEFDPTDASRLATASDQVRLHRFRNHQWTVQFESQEEQRHQGDVSRVSFTPEGECLVSCGFDGRVLLWDANLGHGIGEVPVVPGDSAPLACFTRDGRILVTFGASALEQESTAWAPRTALMRELERVQRNFRPLDRTELEP